MTPGEALAALKRAFPKDVVSSDTAKVYFSALSDVPPDVLAAAVNEIVLTQQDPWLPTIGQIRAVAAEHVLGLPTEEEALRQIDRRREWARDRDGDPPPVHELVQAALDHVGGWAAWRDRDGIVKAQFSRFFRDRRAATVRSAQASPLNLGRALTAGKHPAAQ